MASHRKEDQALQKYEFKRATSRRKDWMHKKKFFEMIHVAKEDYNLGQYSKLLSVVTGELYFPFSVHVQNSNVGNSGKDPSSEKQKQMRTIVQAEKATSGVACRAERNNLAKDGTKELGPAASVSMEALRRVTYDKTESHPRTQCDQKDVPVVEIVSQMVQGSSTGACLSQKRGMHARNRPEIQFSTRYRRRKTPSGTSFASRKLILRFRNIISKKMRNILSQHSGQGRVPNRKGGELAEERKFRLRLPGLSYSLFRIAALYPALGPAGRGILRDAGTKKRFCYAVKFISKHMSLAVFSSLSIVQTTAIMAALVGKFVMASSCVDMLPASQLLSHFCKIALRSDPIDGQDQLYFPEDLDPQGRKDGGLETTAPRGEMRSETTKLKPVGRKCGNSKNLAKGKQAAHCHAGKPSSRDDDDNNYKEPSNTHRRFTKKGLSELKKRDDRLNAAIAGKLRDLKTNMEGPKANAVTQLVGEVPSKQRELPVASREQQPNNSKKHPPDRPSRIGGSSKMKDSLRKVPKGNPPSKNTSRVRPSRMMPTMSQDSVSRAKKDATLALESLILTSERKRMNLKKREEAFRQLMQIKIQYWSYIEIIYPKLLETFFPRGGKGLNREWETFFMNMGQLLQYLRSSSKTEIEDLNLDDVTLRRVQQMSQKVISKFWQLVNMPEKYPAHVGLPMTNSWGIEQNSGCPSSAPGEERKGVYDRGMGRRSGTNPVPEKLGHGTGTGDKGNHSQMIGPQRQEDIEKKAGHDKPVGDKASINPQQNDGAENVRRDALFAGKRRRQYTEDKGLERINRRAQSASMPVIGINADRNIISTKRTTSNKRLKSNIPIRRIGSAAHNSDEMKGNESPAGDATTGKNLLLSAINRKTESQRPSLGRKSQAGVQEEKSADHFKQDNGLGSTPRNEDLEGQQGAKEIGFRHSRSYENLLADGSGPNMESTNAVFSDTGGADFGLHNGNGSILTGYGFGVEDNLDDLLNIELDCGPYHDNVASSLPLPDPSGNEIDISFTDELNPGTPSPSLSFLK